MSPRFLALAALALSCASLTGCVTHSVRRLPTYDECVALKPAGETRFVNSEVGVDELPALIPFAVVATQGSDRSVCMRSVAHSCLEMHPDLVYMGDASSVYAGSVTSVAAGGGIATAVSSPYYEIVLNAGCYRLSPVRLGFSSDTDGMVVALEDSARKSGMQEGDHLVSIDGAPVDKGANTLKSPHYRKMLKMKPGQEVTLVWIRPGTGRMEGKIVCLANPPKHIALPDAYRDIEKAEKARAGRMES